MEQWVRSYAARKEEDGRVTLGAGWLAEYFHVDDWARANCTRIDDDTWLLPKETVLA